MYVTPQSQDGWIRAAKDAGDDAFEIEVVFRVSTAFRELVEGREAEVTFAARSRLARLGINVVPQGDLVWNGHEVGLTARVSAIVNAYDVGRFLPKLLSPGLPVGRLVFCPAERRLTGEEIFRAVKKNELQLPADYSIDGGGSFRIRPRGHVFDLAQPLTFEDLVTVAMRADGKDMLNRLQVRRPVDQIELPPGDGVITSCAMFLHKHYVVLDPLEGPLGRHLEAVVLDPITTRGTDVFLEFANETQHPIVNPAVRAELYHAYPIVSETRRWYGRGVSFPKQADTVVEQRALEYDALANVFDRLEADATTSRYSHRTVAVVDDPIALLDGAEPRALWCGPKSEEHSAPLMDVSSRKPDGIEIASDRSRGTAMLADLPPGTGATLLLGYFPNLVEHLEISAAALEGRIKRIIFRRASFEHGSFLSSRDHGRLADYEGLGVEVFWCNDARKHVVRHVFRGLRGFFVEAESVERFRTSLVVAAYGSAKLLPDEQQQRMQDLITRLHDFFGGSLSIMTGGGPGAMRQATDHAQSMGMLVGASYIETVDQPTNEVSNFYQTFQGRSRQARQRWFEIASFHLFMMGGVGTLEEVGLTLTDMKLGVIELSPLVFFGVHGDKTYWDDQRKQFEVMVKEQRAPEWLLTHSLMTDDPDEVIDFYKRRLTLG
ncbi:MAG: LOG family protein [Planctomycetota bacterium]|nr:LOG family protein [Planctomycetota bacterium]